MDTQTSTQEPLATRKRRAQRSMGAGRTSRRRLLTAAAATGVCAAGVVVAPQLVPLAEQKLQQAALGELKQLEGISLDAAITAAEITQAAVKVIVLPVARLMAILGTGALTVLLGALDAAHNALNFVHAPTTAVDALRTVVASWQNGLSSLPIALTDYLNADINSAVAYLKALRTIVER